ncbi:MAG TPA: DUF2723 domain-containing protein [Elusimicrobiota bacterium]|nr:DUF2723 domain-containing protein [Elusimicrobiota bacterium]
MINRPVAKRLAAASAALGLFFGFFALYLFTAFPALAPYRDSGEMATSAWTLGVSHPTGYPLYIMLGHVMDLVPLGNPAYRLMILSALAGAAAVSALYILSERFFGAIAALGAALLLGPNSDFWAVSQVQEMYSLSILLAVILIALALSLGRAYREKVWLGFVFLFGLFLGNRLEILMLIPGLLWLVLGDEDKNKTALWSVFSFLVFPAIMALSKKNYPLAILIAGTVLWLCPVKDRLRWAMRSAVFAALGLSVYAYLSLRSAAGPWLDWHHPAVFGNLIASVLRTKYGGTLDLISENYRIGQLFGVNMVLYAQHLWRQFSLVGLAACAAGFFKCWRDERRRWLGLLACWYWTGPFFLFIANMPPNPHAAAIVLPYYLLPDIILILWAAEGIAWLAQSVCPALAAAAVAALALAPLLAGRVHAMDRRSHFFSLDYARNVFLCVPPRGTVIVKEDVPVYTLWFYQTVMGLRPEVRVVAQGLSGAPWYQNGFQKDHPNAFIGEAESDAGLKQLAAADAPAFATPDAAVPQDLAGSAKSQGFLIGWQQKYDARASVAPWSLMAFRGDYDYDAYHDFFTSDVVADYSQALYKAGSDAYETGLKSLGLSQIRWGWAMDWLSPQAPAFLGYDAFSRGDYALAAQNYALAARIGARLVVLAGQYAALPGVVAEIKKQEADALMHEGVAEQHLGNPARAERSYQNSLAIYPLAETHYDYAVLYWGKDWGIAARELSLALQVDPRYAPALHYLPEIRSRLAKRPSHR